MISIPITTFSKNRLKRLSALYQQIKTMAGIPCEVLIGVNGNRDMYTALKEKKIGDRLILLPKNIEATHALNVLEKFAQYPYVVVLDDSVTIHTDHVFKKALRYFRQHFPDGQGLMGFHDGIYNSPRYLTTRAYTYQMNLGNLIWPEYIHSGDDELCIRSRTRHLYFYAPDIVIKECKIHDYSKRKTQETHRFDAWVIEQRKLLQFPTTLLPDYDAYFRDEATKSPYMKRLYKNIYNVNKL